jgi:predicted anti-sigma-YlaC factor YlaD
MNCEDIKNLLPIYKTGELSEDDKNHIKNHLNECLSCRTEFEDLNKINSVLKDAIELEEVPVIQSIPATKHFRKRFLIAAALVIFTVLISFIFLQQNKQAPNFAWEDDSFQEILNFHKEIDFIAIGLENQKKVQYNEPDGMFNQTQLLNMEDELELILNNKF